MDTGRGVSCPERAVIVQTYHAEIISGMIQSLGGAYRIELRSANTHVVDAEHDTKTGDRMGGSPGLHRLTGHGVNHRR